MSLSLNSLEALALRKPLKTGKPPWQPIEVSDLQPGTYLAADPSLLAFGLVLFEVGRDRRPVIHMAQQFKVGPTKDKTGWEDLLSRIGTLERLLTAYFTKWIARSSWGQVLAVHEMPPMGGGKMHSVEVSLLASYAFRNVCRNLPILPMVPRQQHAHMICGDRNADKRVAHAALKIQFLPKIRGSELITNESSRDALCVALYAALTRKGA